MVNPEAQLHKLAVRIHSFLKTVDSDYPSDLDIGMPTSLYLNLTIQTLSFIANDDYSLECLVKHKVYAGIACDKGRDDDKFTLNTHEQLFEI